MTKWPMHCAVVLPVRGEAQLTRAITEQLRHEDFDLCLISDNNDTPDAETVALVRELEEQDPRFHCYLAPGLGITHQWNTGWERAEGALGENTAVLFVNNDVSITQGTVGLMRSLLEEDEDLWVIAPDCSALVGRQPKKPKIRHVEGTFRVGGIPGWCFMVRPSVAGQIGGRFWEKLVWWYSDDQFVDRVIRARGKVGIVDKLGLAHINEATAVHYPELAAQKEQDRLTYERWLRFGQ